MTTGTSQLSSCTVRRPKNSNTISTDTIFEANGCRCKYRHSSIATIRITLVFLGLGLSQNPHYGILCRTAPGTGSDLRNLPSRDLHSYDPACGTWCPLASTPEMCLITSINLPNEVDHGALTRGFNCTLCSTHAVAGVYNIRWQQHNILHQAALHSRAHSC
jgi:hypothetical protein